MGCWYAFALYYQDRRSGQCKFLLTMSADMQMKSRWGLPALALAKDTRREEINVLAGSVGE